MSDQTRNTFVPHCDAINRIPTDTPAAKAKCGRFLCGLTCIESRALAGVQVTSSALLGNAQVRDFVRHLGLPVDDAMNFPACWGLWRAIRPHRDEHIGGARASRAATSPLTPCKAVLAQSALAPRG